MNRDIDSPVKIISRSLPEFRVRRSARARHVNLTINPIDGLVVVVPNGFDEQLIPALLLEQRDWINARLTKYNGSFSESGPWQPPQSIELSAAEECWQVDYRSNAGTSVRITCVKELNVRISGNLDDETALRQALRRWLQRQARRILIPRLASLAAAHDLQFSTVSIRHQRSRWGSCSISGAISLNAKLAFLPAELVDHILLHELCHLVHRDHGRGFHALLARLDPAHRQHRKALRNIWSEIPEWALR